MRYEIKELGVGGILDQAVKLVRDNFALLAGTVLVLYFPFAIVSGVVVAGLMPDAALLDSPETAPIYQEDVMKMIFWTYGLAIPSLLIVIPLTNAAVIHAVASLYLDKPISIGAAYSRAFRVWLPIIGTGFLWYLAIVGGMMLCLIPGILCLFWFALVFQVVVIEGSSGFTALKRSRELMRGNISTYFVLLLLLGVIGLGVGAASSLIPQPHLEAVVGSVTQSALFILGSAANVVFYFSCRCRHENFDLQLLAASVGDAAPFDDTEGASL